MFYEAMHDFVTLQFDECAQLMDEVKPLYQAAMGECPDVMVQMNEWIDKW